MKNTLTSPKNKIPGSAWIDVTARAITSANFVHLQCMHIYCKQNFYECLLGVRHCNQNQTVISIISLIFFNHFNHVFLIFFVYAMNIQGPQSPFPFEEKLLYKLVN